MKKSIFIFSVLLMMSCKKEEVKKEPLYPSTETETTQTPEELGLEIFDGKGKCVTCHRIDTKLIGPSLKDIAKIYKEKNGNIVTFLKGEADPIVDPSQFEVMKANFAVTKAMCEEDLKALEVYIYSHLKQ